MLKEARQPDAAPGAASRLRILLVEDHLSTAELMRKLLEAHGFSVRQVGSHREALAAASEWLPDVLVSDVGLPGKDGIELMRTLRTAYPGLRGIVVSGYANDEDVERSRAAGFAEHLAKPISTDRLIAAIHRLFQPNAGGPEPTPQADHT